MGRMFGALARAATGYRKGTNLREQQEWDRDMQERELMRRAFEFDATQRANRQWRDDQVQWRDEDRATREALAAEARAEKAKLEQTNAIEQGWENAEDPTSAAAAAMSTLSGGTGAATQGWDTGAVERAGKQMRGVAPFMAQEGDATFGAPTRVAPVQRGQIGGKQMTYDPQKKVNAAGQAAWEKHQAALAMEKERAADREAQIRLTASLRPAPAANTSRADRNVNQLAGQYQRNPVVKDAYGLADAVAGIQSGLAGDSGMSDLETVYSVIKLFDPNSVVKEGEIKLTRSANSLPGKAKLLYDSWTRGRVLTPSMRQQIADLVEERIRGSESRVGGVQRSFGQQARQRGLEADSAFIAPSPYEGISRGAGSGGATTPNQTGKPQAPSGTTKGGPASPGGETDEQRIKRLLGKP